MPRAPIRRNMVCTIKSWVILIMCVLMLLRPAKLWHIHRKKSFKVDNKNITSFIVNSITLLFLKCFHSLFYQSMLEHLREKELTFIRYERSFSVKGTKWSFNLINFRCFSKYWPLQHQRKNITLTLNTPRLGSARVCEQDFKVKGHHFKDKGQNDPRVYKSHASFICP